MNPGPHAQKPRQKMRNERILRAEAELPLGWRVGVGGCALRTPLAARGDQPAWWTAGTDDRGDPSAAAPRTAKHDRPRLRGWLT